MNKNILLTATAVAIVAALGYAAYTNGSFGDLGEAINNQVLSAVSGGVDYFSAAMFGQKMATSTRKSLIKTKEKVTSKAERATTTPKKIERKIRGRN